MKEYVILYIFYKKVSTRSKAVIKNRSQKNNCLLAHILFFSAWEYNLRPLGRTCNNYTPLTNYQMSEQLGDTYYFEVLNYILCLQVHSRVAKY